MTTATANQNGFFNVRDFGAGGIAEPGPTHRLEEDQHFCWIPYPAGLQRTIYRARPGATYDSVGIQKAIDTAAEAGGGTVVVPAGDYLIAPIRLRSHVNLHLQPGATLWGSPNLADYIFDEVPDTSLDTAFGRAGEGLSGENKQRLIWASNENGFALTGKGQINAQSGEWIFAWLASGPDNWIRERPTDTILFDRCSDITVEGITIRDTPSWTLVFSSCHGIEVRGVKIHSIDCFNSDGIDLVDSTEATIADCRLHVTDDAICFKTTRPDGIVRNVTVTNCIIRTLCNGFKLGTDSTGGFENIAVSNLVIHNPDGEWVAPGVAGCAEGGINLCSVDGGWIRNLSISNIVMRNVRSPFYILTNAREHQQTRFRSPRPGTMENVSLSNITAEGYRYTPFVIGHPDESIRHLTLENIRLEKGYGFYDDVPPSPPPVTGYPQPYMFGGDPTHARDGIPAHGLYMRDVKGATLRDVRVRTREPDARPMFNFERCEDIDAMPEHPSMP